MKKQGGCQRARFSYVCFLIFEWLQDEKPLDQSDEVLRRNPKEAQGSLMKGCQMKLKEA